MIIFCPVPQNGPKIAIMVSSIVLQEDAPEKLEDESWEGFLGGGRCGERAVCEELGDTKNADDDGHDMASMFLGRIGPWQRSL